MMLPTLPLATRNSNTQQPDNTSVTVGYEAQLWHMADALRGSRGRGYDPCCGSSGTFVQRKHGYPPDEQEKATRTVLEQAALLSADWAVA